MLLPRLEEVILDWWRSHIIGGGGNIMNSRSTVFFKMLFYMFGWI